MPTDLRRHHTSVHDTYILRSIELQSAIHYTSKALSHHRTRTNGMTNSHETVPDPAHPRFVIAILGYLWVIPNSRERFVVFSVPKCREWWRPEQLSDESRCRYLNLAINFYAEIVNDDFGLLEWVRALYLYFAAAEGKEIPQL